MRRTTSMAVYVHNAERMIVSHQPSAQACVSGSTILTSGRIASNNKLAMLSLYDACVELKPAQNV